MNVEELVVKIDGKTDITIVFDDGITEHRYGVKIAEIGPNYVALTWDVEAELRQLT